MPKKKILSLMVVLLVTACSHQPKLVLPAPSIKTIAIIPASAPKKFTLLNVSALAFVFPISQTFTYLNSEEKAKVFNERMQDARTALPAVLTEAVVDSLQRRGYRVEVLHQVPRSADDPDDVDRQKVVTESDAVLQLKFSEVGLYSGRVTVDYLPRVQIRGSLFVRGREDDELYDEEIYWGVDAKKGNPLTIESDPSFAYSSFDAVIGNLPSVRLAFDTGISEAAKRLTMLVDTSLKP